MKNKKLIGFAIVILLAFSQFSLSSSQIDKLKRELERTNTPKQKIGVLLDIINLKLNVLDRDNLKYLKQANKIAKENNYEEYNAVINRNLGEYWKIFGDFDKSTEYHFKSIDYFEKTENEKELAISYLGLAETYRAAAIYKKALKYLKTAENLSEDLANDYLLAKTYNRKAAVLYEMHEGSKREVIDYAIKSNSLIDLNSSFDLAVNNYTIIGGTYRFFKKYDSAETYFYKALRLSKRKNDVYNYPTILANLCYSYYSKGEIEKAINYGKRAYKFKEEKGLNLIEPYLYNTLSNAYFEIGDYKNAAFFLQKTVDSQDSLFYLDKNKILFELQTKYETKKKERELEKQKSLRNYQIVFSAILILLIVVIVFQYNYRNKELRKKNALITEQNKKLEETNATKDKFFSIIAHDLKNPIFSQKGITDILANDYDELSDEEIREMLQVLHNATENISDLLENLLNWSRSQRGAIEFYPSDIDLNLIFMNIQSLMEAQVAKKKIDLNVDTDNEIKVYADNNMLNTILRNLMSNAIKYTPEGGKIQLRATETNDFVEIAVKDSGVGIEKDDIDKLFKADVNFTTRGTGNESGTGLGLLVCKEFVEKHGGKIWVESRPGKGSSFKFTIPTKFT